MTTQEQRDWKDRTEPGRMLRQWHNAKISTDELTLWANEFFRPPPEHTCHWCGKTDSENEDDGYGPLVDIFVLVANGEEGQAEQLRYVCNDHLIEQSRALINLGYGVHKHGGTNFLEPMDCPGYDHMDDCPTPEDDE